MRVEEEDVYRLELLYVSVSLELLSDLCANGGNGHIERVHLLDFRSLSNNQIPVQPVVCRD